jgi:hypothetical protein
VTSCAKAEADINTTAQSAATPAFTPITRQSGP